MQEPTLRIGVSSQEFSLSKVTSMARPLKHQILWTLKIVDQWQRGVSPLIQPNETDLTILRYLGFLEQDSNQVTPEGRSLLRNKGVS